MTSGPVWERFINKTVRDQGCWLWCAATDKGGYGLFSVGGKTVRAHRFAYAAYYERQPRQHLLHRCGRRACVNPRHLREGTPLENAADMRRHGTVPTGNRNGSRTRPESLARGEYVGSAKLTAADVKRIRRAYANGHSALELARDYGVSKSTISRAVNGVQWRHVR